VGKTTLARQIGALAEGAVHYFDVEDYQTFAALKATPDAITKTAPGLVIIDEIQRLPVLFEVLRPACDRVDRRTSYLLLGSASWEFVRGISETLAGRILFVEVPGFSIGEVGATRQEDLWLSGGFPRAFLAENAGARHRWLESFLTTFVQRDIAQLGSLPGGSPEPALFERFWRMLAHCHGQCWNASALGKSLNISQPTLVRYRDLLNAAYMLRVLQPWFENNGKRLVKAPKVYFRDSGLLHLLFNISDMTSLRLDPHYGASWEGFALEQTLIAHGGREAYFYATQNGAELDLLLARNGKLWGFEFKCAEAPATTKSMHIALQDLKLEHLFVVHPGVHRYPLADKITALPLNVVAELTL
jgi:predicted AAA+ superfamily ATPase